MQSSIQFSFCSRRRSSLLLEQMGRLIVNFFFYFRLMNLQLVELHADNILPVVHPGNYSAHFTEGDVKQMSVGKCQHNLFCLYEKHNFQCFPLFVKT